MFARRFLIAGLIALVIAIGVRSAVSTQSATPTEPDATRVNTAWSDTVLAPATSSPETTSSVPLTSVTAVSSPIHNAVEVAPTPTLAPAELVDLVAASRPSLSAVEVVDDGDLHAHHDTPDSSVGAIAASVVVSAWTWRFDDTAGRVHDQLAGLADDDVIRVLAPTPQEMEARAATGEVSWVIVRTVTVTGSNATVLFDHHLVTSTSAEAVTNRTAVVTVIDGQAIEVNL